MLLFYILKMVACMTFMLMVFSWFNYRKESKEFHSKSPKAVAWRKMRNRCITILLLSILACLNVRGSNANNSLGFMEINESNSYIINQARGM